MENNTISVISVGIPTIMAAGLAAHKEIALPNGASISINLKTATHDSIRSKIITTTVTFCLMTAENVPANILATKLTALMFPEPAKEMTVTFQERYYRYDQWHELRDVIEREITIQTH